MYVGSCWGPDSESSSDVSRSQWAQNERDGRYVLSHLRSRVPCALTDCIWSCVAGTIFAGKIDCQVQGSRHLYGKPLQERAVTDPNVTLDANGFEAVLTVATRPVGFNDCFEHVEIEYFHGEPQRLYDARLERNTSLSSKGYSVPDDGFAKTQEVIVDAVRDERSARIPTVSVEDLASYRNRTARADRHLSHSSCYLGASDDITLELFGTDCTNLPPGAAMESTTCYWREEYTNVIALKVGNTYNLRWRSSATNPNVDIHIVQRGFVWGSTPCVDLSPGSSLPNQAFSGSVPSSPNSFTFQMPNLRASGAACADAFQSGFPEFQITIFTPQGGCHRSYMKLNNQITSFRLVQNTATGSRTFSLNVPAQYELGDASAGLRVKCASCHASGTGDIHVLLRTSAYNPFDETWSWGSLSMTGNVNVEAQAYVSTSRTLGPFQVLPRSCIPGLCLTARVAGIDLMLGVMADLWVGARATFDATATLTYARTLSSSGTLAHHTKRGDTLINTLNGFVPGAPQDSSPTSPQLRLNIDATARVHVTPRFYAGFFLSATSSLQAEAFVKVEVQLSLSAQFNFRSAIGTSNYFPARNSAPVALLSLLPPVGESPPPAPAPAGSPQTCANALIGCSSACSGNHDTHLGFQLSVTVYGTYRIYVQASFFGFSLTLGTSSEVRINPYPFFTFNRYIGSFCYYLFPQSLAPPPLGHSHHPHTPHTHYPPPPPPLGHSHHPHTPHTHYPPPPPPLGHSHHPHTPTHYPPPQPQSGGACTETCNYASDGFCDDGGPGSQYNDCSVGTDCTDCGPRSSLPPPQPQTGGACTETCNYAADADCDDGGLGAEYTDCAYGTDCTDCGPRLAPPPQPQTGGACTETCTYAADAWCDDGGPGAAFTECAYGTDCTD